jgi:4-diphosphocytidyl-2-C-methyl-D-erythritol kinase
MLAFPNAKINLGLHILNRRSDGFHDIETVFYPVHWCDVLEIILSDQNQVKSKSTSFRSSGIKIIGSKQKNLCIKAFELLKQKYNLPQIQMHLHKVIPIGAGLGGGSSDASHALMLLNNLFNLRMTREELESEATKLGSDCAFFIRNKPVLAKGKGNEFEEIEVTLKDYFLVIVKPDIYINTADAYKSVTLSTERKSLKEITEKPVSEWKKYLVNDFEKSIFNKYPLVEYVKKELYYHGATYASMSGSGSAVYGIFKEKVNLETKFEDCQTWSGWLE